MIQRRQTLYLLLALAAIVACLCLPIGRLEPVGMGVDSIWYNMGQYRDGAFLPKPVLFIDLIIVGILALADIFLYHRRRLQARLCVANIVLCVLWYGCYGAYAYGAEQAGVRLHVSFAACLPFVAIVLFFIARRGIIADEKLVRSMDRIR